MIETIVPAPIPGAGRMLDVTWPGILSLRPGNGTNIGALGSFTRQGSQAPINNTTAQSATGVASSIQWGTGTGYFGRSACLFKPGTGAPGLGAAQSMDPMVITPSFAPAANQSDASDTDDFRCFRLFAVMSFQPQPSYAGDTGFTCVALNAGNMDLTTSAKGFGICQKAANQVSFIMAPALAGGLTINTPIFTGDVAVWRTYELRVLGATPSSNAKVKVFVNGTQVVQFDWVNDGFPDPLHSNGSYGFQTYIVAHGGGVGGAGAAGLALDHIRFIVGPTEASLL